MPHINIGWGSQDASYCVEDFENFVHVIYANKRWLKRRFYFVDVGKFALQLSFQNEEFSVNSNLRMNEKVHVWIQHYFWRWYKIFESTYVMLFCSVPLLFVSLCIISLFLSALRYLFISSCSLLIDYLFVLLVARLPSPADAI